LRKKTRVRLDRHTGQLDGMLEDVLDGMLEVIVEDMLDDMRSHRIDRGKQL